MLINDFEKLSLKKFKIKSILPDATVLCLGKRRSGKCLAKGTKVLMFDGSIQHVETITPGQLVMGDDSTPRTVVNTTRGTDIMYTVNHVANGETYTVNSHHILSLKWVLPKRINFNIHTDCFTVSWFENTTIKRHQRDFKTFTEASTFFDTINERLDVDIGVPEYLQLDQFHQEHLWGYQVPIDFPEQPIEL